MRMWERLAAWCLALVCFQLVCFHLLFVQLAVTGAEKVKGFTARKRPEMADKVVNNLRLIWQRQQSSAYHCLGECSRDVNCVSVFYNPTSSKCQGHSITFGNQHQTEPETSNRYYVRPHGEGYIGDSCASTVDCVTANAECRNGGCWCGPGFGFSPQTRQCLSGCDKLGDDFTEFRDFYISKTNVEVINSVSLSDCFILCTNRTEYSCLSVEYGRSTNKCYLANATYLEWPDRWYYDGDGAFNISYYERDCV